MKENFKDEKDIKKLANTFDSIKSIETTFNIKDRLDYYDKRIEDKSYLSAGLLKKIKVKYSGKFLGLYKIFEVNGDVLRTKIDIDFVSGGNPTRYAYLPENEIWIDENLHPNDFAAIAIHEFVEYMLMKYKKKSYDDAHDKASVVELKFRKKHFKEENQSIETEMKKANEFVINFLKNKKVA